MANEKVYIYDEQNIKINVYEEPQTELHIINGDPSLEVVRIYEPGSQGPKGNDGGSYEPPSGIVSSSNQVKELLPTGTISGSEQLTGSYDSRYELKGSNLLSSSQQISSDISGSFTNLSGSFAGRVSVFENKTLFSSSQQVNFAQLQNIPSGLLSSSNGFISSSQQLTQSYDQRYELRGSGILSSSQTFALKTEISGAFYSYTQSSDTRLGRLEQQTSSYAQISVLTPLFEFTSSTNQRLQIIELSTSSYVRNDSTSSFVNNSQTSSFLNNSFTSSFNLYTSSNDTKVQRLEQQTSSYAIKTEISGAFTNTSSSLSQRINTFETKTLFSGSSQVQYSQITGIPTGLLSSSNGFVSSSQQLSSDISGSFTNLSSSLQNRISTFENKTLVSSSQQINTGSFTGSFEGDGSGLIGIQSASYALTASYVSGSSSNSISSSYSVTSSYASFALSASYVPNVTLPSNLISSSAQINYNGLTGVPSGILSSSNGFISSSQQIANDISGSFVSVSSSFQGRISTLENKTIISGSDQLTGSYDLRYETRGNNIVSSSNQITGLGFITNTNLTNLNNFTSSIQSQVDSLKLTSGSLNIFSASIQSEVNNLKSVTGSYLQNIALLPLNNFSGSTNLRLGSLESTTGSLNEFSGSAQNRLNLIESTTGSLNNITGSIISRLGSLEVKTGSYATTGSNIFKGQQIISGSVNMTGSLEVIGQVSGTFVGNGSGLTGVVTSSYALTASYALNGGGGGTNIQSIGARIFTQDTSISSGLKGYRHIGYNSNIIKVRTIANVQGNIDINIKRSGSNLGTISLLNQSSSLDTTLSGWTTSLNQNDLLEFYVSQSSTYITDITFFMDLQSI